ncbi:MAG: PEP-CTERM sorting domain-containing protein [Pseudomonadota bacterium]|nr:PEP-CTERM sorting domain-containing protein [Pseudomonadota bacterium]
MQTRQTISALVLAAIISTPAAAGVIDTNLTTSFNLTGTFSQAIDADVLPNAVSAAQRLFNSRLGDWQSTAATTAYTHSYSISVLDPGVSALPAEARLLLNVKTQATISGNVIGDVDKISSIDTKWSCANTVLKCSSSLVGKSDSGTLTHSSFANANDVLGGFHVLTAAQTDLIFPGVQLASSSISVSGSMKLATTYQAKTPLAYSTDAINATAAAVAATRTARFSNAAADIATLRNSTYADSAVVSSVAGNIELGSAHKALAYTRDSVQLLAATAAGQTSFSSRSGLLRNIWDVTALGDPALGRNVAESNADPFAPDNLVELAAFKAAANSTDDASYLTQLGLELATPLTSSTQPLMILDGAQFGADGAEIRVFYYDGESQGVSDLVLNLPAAERHALMRASYSNLTVLSGPEAGLAFIASSGDGVVTPGNSEYIGETFSGALLLDGDNAAWEISLDNFFSPQFVVLASWNVTAVPEPETWLMLVAGLAMLSAQRRKLVTG